MGRNFKKNSFLNKPWLNLRNIFTLIATILFIVSILFNHKNMVLKFAAYLCGMLAYIFEFVALTDGFKKRIPHDELFMIYCFAPLYLLLGVSYLLH